MEKQLILNEIKQRIVAELINTQHKNKEMLGPLIDKINNIKTLKEFVDKCTAIANNTLDKYDTQVSEELH